mgnify:CR=1 FL=1
MSERIDLDVRWLEPPEPFERVVASLDALPQGATLRVLIHRLPRPLFQWLEREAWTYSHSFDPEGFFEILIRR